MENDMDIFVHIVYNTYKEYIHARHIKQTERRPCMTAEAREARNAYLREWRRQNPDKVKQQRERYWNRQAEKMRKEWDESGKGRSRD